MWFSASDREIPYFIGHGLIQDAFRGTCPKESILIQDWPTQADAEEQHRRLFEYYETKRNTRTQRRIEAEAGAGAKPN